MAIRRNSIVNLSGSVVGLILFASLTPLYFNVIGGERYGILAILWAFLAFFAAFDFGMGAALTYLIAREGRAGLAHQADHFWTAMAISLPVGLVTGIGLFGLVGGGLGNLFHLSPAVHAEMFHSAPSLLAIGICTVLLSTAGGLFQGREFFVSNALLNTGSLILSILLPVLAALLISPSLDVLILATLAGRVTIVAAAILTAHFAILERARPSASQAAARALIGYGAWSSVGGMIELSISSADRFILGAVAGPVAVGYYSVPSSVLARVMVFPTSLGVAAMPQMASRSPEEEIALAGKVVRMVAMLTPCFVGGIFLAAPFLRLWMGPAFAAMGTVPMEILLPAFWMDSISALLFYRLLAQGRPRTIAIIAALILVPYCLLLYCLAGVWGVSGGAAAFLGRSAMLFGGRAAATRSWRMLFKTVGLDLLLLTIALIACLTSWPAQPPLIVAILVTGVSLALTFRRRPPEVDHMVRDALHHLTARIRRPLATGAGSGLDE